MSSSPLWVDVSILDQLRLSILQINLLRQKKNPKTTGALPVKCDPEPSAKRPTESADGSCPGLAFWRRAEIECVPQIPEAKSVPSPPARAQKEFS